MKNSGTSCNKYQKTDNSDTNSLFGYTICKSVVSRLGLFHGTIIKKRIVTFGPNRKKNLSSTSYEEEIRHKLVYLERDCISKKIKLLHIQEQIKHVK